MSIIKGPKFKKPEGEEGDVMLPFMSLLLIIIPVLISNIAFYHFSAIAINVPGTSKNEEKKDDKTDDAKKEEQLVLQLTIEENNLVLDLINEETGEVITKDTIAISSESANDDLRNKVIGHRIKHKKIDSLLISVNENIKYDRMVTVLEKVQKPDAEQEVTKELTLVLMPKGVGEDG